MLLPGTYCQRKFPTVSLPQKHQHLPQFVFSLIYLSKPNWGLFTFRVYFQFSNTPTELFFLKYIILSSDEYLFYFFIFYSWSCHAHLLRLNAVLVELVRSAPKCYFGSCLLASISPSVSLTNLVPDVFKYSILSLLTFKYIFH